MKTLKEMALADLRIYKVTTDTDKPDSPLRLYSAKYDKYLTLNIDDLYQLANHFGYTVRKK